MDVELAGNAAQLPSEAAWSWRDESPRLIPLLGLLDTITGTGHHGGRKLGFSISERRLGNLTAQPSVPPLLLYVLCCSLRIFLHEIHQKGTFPFQSLAKKTGPAVVATLIKPCNSNWLWNCSFLACVSCSSIVSPLFLMISFFKAPPTHACAFLTDVPFVPTQM